MDQSEQAIRERLLRFAKQMDGRDQLIRDAHRAGLSKTDIHRITGIARTTIDRIVGTIPQTSGPGESPLPPRGPGAGPANPPGR